MAVPALTLEPLETALTAKVRELFGDAARLQYYLDEGEPTLEIRTTLGPKAADLHLRNIYDWVVERYPYDTTVIGLLHVHQL